MGLFGVNAIQSSLSTAEYNSVSDAAYFDKTFCFICACLNSNLKKVGHHEFIRGFAWFSETFPNHPLKHLKLPCTQVFSKTSYMTFSLAS